MRMQLPHRHSWTLLNCCVVRESITRHKLFCRKALDDVGMQDAAKGGRGGRHWGSLDRSGAHGSDFATPAPCPRVRAVVSVAQSTCGPRHSVLGVADGIGMDGDVGSDASLEVMNIRPADIEAFSPAGVRIDPQLQFVLLDGTR